MRRGLISALTLLVATALLVPGCGDSVDADVALEEPIRVGYISQSQRYNAQFFSGDLPQPAGGPPIIGVDVGPAQAIAGKQRRDGYSVRLDASAYAVAVRLEGRTNGYWVARVDQIEALFTNQVSASLFFDIAPSVTPETYHLELSGISRDGHFGTRATAPLTVVPSVPPNVPVDIRLRWDNYVDLDLQLLAPDGTFLSPKHPTTSPSGPVGADAGVGTGRLDHDSMASCVNDGVREENVIFSDPPSPSGKYKIYVNPFDLCRKVGTNYEVSIIRNGDVEQRFIGRVSSAEVQRGGFAIGDFVTEVTF